MRANLVPGFLLQCLALAVVVGYFSTPEVRAVLDELGAFKRRWGYLYSAGATALCGGLVPYLMLLGRGRVPPRQRWQQLVFYVLFWLWKGVEVDALYRGQALAFGDNGGAFVIAAKTGLDQFVYNPLWAAPTQVLCFLWKDAGFSLAGLRQRLRERSLAMRSVVILLSTWVVWIPAVAVIYSIPSPLQIPLFNLVLCFWSLLLTFVVSHPGEGPATE